jgi:ribosomal protein S18 acetylase RimI-like enzyme
MANVEYRPLHLVDDALELFALFEAAKVEDQIDPYSTLEGLPTSVSQMQEWIANFVPGTHIAAVINGQVVGYNHIIWWTEADGTTLYLHLGRVHPRYRGMEIGSALLEWSEKRIRELAAEQGVPKPMFGANASSTEVTATQLLLDHNYQVVWNLSQMEFAQFDELAPSTLPDALEIRTAKPDEAETLWRAELEAWVHDNSFGRPTHDEAEILELRSNIERSGQYWKIAWDGERVAAQVWCSLHDFDDGTRVMHIDEVHTLPPYRRRGIARALLVEALRQCEALKVNFARLHTDANNGRGAKSLYTQIGFRELKTFPRYRKPF